MQRYFSDNYKDNSIVLNTDDTYHITKVMRMNIGDAIEVVSFNKVYRCVINNIKDLVEANILEEIKENNELSIQVDLVQSLIKEVKMDFVLQKSTELGVNKIIPYSSSRGVVKVEKKDFKKIGRWQRIIKEAAEQSKRNIIPSISDIHNIDDIISLTDYDIKILCTVNEKSKNFKKVLSNIKTNGKMLIVVGPEGGFTKGEEEKFMNNNFISISLGSSVLRSETASLFILSAIRYHLLEEE